MRKAIYVVLVAMLAFTASAWAQVNPTDSMLGPHNVAQKGCKSCHAPHNGAEMNGGTDASTGKIYLWGRDFKAATYTTFGGGTLETVAQPDEAWVVIHTQMCLSCHDGGVSGASMGTEALVASDTESLENDHPVHTIYAPATTTRPYNWNITVASGRASFVDTTWEAGHPARLYVDAPTNTAYVECSTCHNPHSQNTAIVKIAGVNTAKTSSKFVRGWYDPADGSTQANFCRSCHLSKSTAYDGSVK